MKYFPRWLPGIHGFKTFAERSNQLCEELINHLFDGVKKDVVSAAQSAALIRFLAAELLNSRIMYRSMERTGRHYRRTLFAVQILSSPSLTQEQRTVKEDYTKRHSKM